MPDKPKATKSWGAVQIAILAGMLLGALLARPVIKPWLDAHSSGYTFKDWPVLVSFLPWVAFSMY